MLLVKTYIKNSPVHGIGLFATEFIPKGTTFWKLSAPFDVVLTQEEYEKLPELAKSYFDHFAYYNTLDGGWVLCGDNARFTNHSVTPSYREDKNNECVMCKDVLPDEEIFGNYFDFNERKPKL